MNSENSLVLFKTVKDLYRYVEDYSKSKVSKTANSLGVIFTDGEVNYWYDSGTSKVVELDDKTCEFIKLLQTYDLNPEKFEQAVEMLEIDEEELITFINREDLFKGFKIKNLHSSEFLKFVHNQIQQGCTQLIIELTQACNMRCKYCIYNDTYSGNRNFGSKNISLEDAKSAIDYIFAEGDKNEIDITFYGGEPLINFEVLKGAIEYSISKSKLDDRKVNFSFTTNLTLLNDEMINFFKGVNNLSIMCSIDGPREIHDEYRVYKGGKGTFNDVIKNFEKLCSISSVNDTFHVSVNSVYMPPYSIEKVEKIDSFFKNISYTPKNFDYQIGYPSLDTLPEYLIDDIYYEDQTLRHWQQRKAVSCNTFDEIHQTSFTDPYVKIHSRPITKRASNKVSLNGCCVAGFRRLYVTVDGNILPCERVGFAPSLGNIHSGIDLDSLFTNYIFKFSDAWTPYCNDCWSAKLCSACYVDRVSGDGINQPDMAICEYERQSNLIYLGQYHYLLRVDSEKLEALNKDIVI